MTAPSLEKLNSMTDAEVIELYDRSATNTAVGTNFLMEEIRARETGRVNKQIAFLTRLMTFLTVVITVATITNVVVFLNDSPTIPGFLR